MSGGTPVTEIVQKVVETFYQCFGCLIQWLVVISSGEVLTNLFVQLYHFIFTDSTHFSELLNVLTACYIVTSNGQISK